MDKLQAMQVFTRVVETKSFTGAAASLDMTRSSATTIVQNLEAHLKVRLLNRTTRNISLTPDGAAITNDVCGCSQTSQMRKTRFPVSPHLRES